MNVNDGIHGGGNRRALQRPSPRPAGGRGLGVRSFRRRSGALTAPAVRVDSPPYEAVRRPAARTAGCRRCAP